MNSTITPGEDAAPAAARPILAEFEWLKGANGDHAADPPYVSITIPPGVSALTSRMPFSISDSNGKRTTLRAPDDEYELFVVPGTKVRVRSEFIKKEVVATDPVCSILCCLFPSAWTEKGCTTYSYTRECHRLGIIEIVGH